MSDVVTVFGVEAKVRNMISTCPICETPAFVHAICTDGEGFALGVSDCLNCDSRIFADSNDTNPEAYPLESVLNANPFINSRQV